MIPTIEELAVKHHIIYPNDVVKLAQIQAFAQELLAVNSSEVVAYGLYTQISDKEELTHLSVKGGGWKDSLTYPLFRANPINTALVDEIKRLREALSMLNDINEAIYRNHDIDAIIRGAINTPATIKEILEK